MVRELGDTGQVQVSQSYTGRMGARKEEERCMRCIGDAGQV